MAPTPKIAAAVPNFKSSHLCGMRLIKTFGKNWVSFVQFLSSLQQLPPVTCKANF